jgi:uncharacterized protein YndB with AHSA1/START domain
MSDFERTFEVTAPVERAWSALTEPEELEVWFAGRFETNQDDGTSTAASPGGPVGFSVVEFDLHSRLRYRQWAASPDRGVDVTVVFESIESGTRITMTQSGFGGETILQSESVQRGMDEALADLVAYLEHGSRTPRHRDMNSMATLSLEVRDTRAGTVVVSVTPDGCAERAGLRPGDLLLQLGRAPVFDAGDVIFFVREREPGDGFDVTWVRNGETHRGHAMLDRRDEMVFAHVS